MTQRIKIRNLNGPDEDQLIQFEITISNDQAKTSLVLYGYKDNFVDFGRELIHFPKDLKDNVTYKQGEEKVEAVGNWNSYLLLNVFCYNRTGQSAMRIVTSNNQDVPGYSRSEFYLTVEPAFFNELGIGLKNWDPEQEKEFEWSSN